MYIPMYKNLSVERIMDFIGDHDEINFYLPDDPDLAKVPKQWLINVCATVIGDPFRNWVKQQKEESNALMAEKKELMIAMDPVMAAKFQASTHVSRK